MKDFFVDRRPHEGLTYDAYQARWQLNMQQPMGGLDRVARKYVFYSRYNWERAERVQAAYEVSSRLRNAVKQITKPQLWMVLTEDWCVDSAYSLPVFMEAALINPLIEVRILLRDSNLDIMDHYQTRGARSIPKVVAFSEAGTDLFTWGPRPEEARQLREEWKAAGMSGAQVSAALLAWYEEGNWQQVDTELAELLEKLGAHATALAGRKQRGGTSPRIKTRATNQEETRTSP